MKNETTLKGLVEISTKDAQLMLETGYFLMEMRQTQKAEEVFKGLVALFPNTESPHIALGNLYHAQGKFKACLEEHQKASSSNPYSGTAYASMGEALLFLGEFEKAAEMLDKALEVEPEGPAADFARALRVGYEMGVFKGIKQAG